MIQETLSIIIIGSGHAILWSQPQDNIWQGQTNEGLDRTYTTD